MGDRVNIVAHTLLGKEILRTEWKAGEGAPSLSMSTVQEKMIVITIEGIVSYQALVIIAR